jgi:hypothetical protein
MEISRSPNFSIDVRIRRVVIGFTAGLISSVALVTTFHSVFLGITLGAVVGALYALAVRPTRFAYAESMFTAGSLGIPLWAELSASSCFQHSLATVRNGHLTTCESCFPNL